MTLVWLALGLITLSGTFFGAGIAFYRWKETAHQMAAHPTLAPPLIGAPPAPNLRANLKSLPPGTPAASAPSSPQPASNDPKAQASPDAPKDAQNQKYGVELGVFFAQENAVDLMDKLNVRQIQTVVKPQKNRAGVTVFSVQSADEFPSQRAAEVAARILSSQNHLSAVAILLPEEAQAQPSGEQK
jgi:cell division septation protein DedD